MISLHKRYGLITVAVLVLLFVFVVGGCGPKPQEEATQDPAPTTPTTPTTPDPDPGTDLRITQWRNPDDIGKMVAYFSELAWTMTVDGQPLTCGYLLEEMEIHNGREVARAVFDVDMSAMDGTPVHELRLWLDNGGMGDILQVELDGDLLADPSIANFMLEVMTGMMFVPFRVMDDARADAVLGVPGAGEAPDVDWTIKSTSTEQIGTLTATVYTLGVDVRLDEFLHTTQEWAIADFGDFHMLVGWGAVGRANGDEVEFSMNVTRLAPR